MSTFDSYYDINPVASIDQNKWTEQIAELVLQFRQQPVTYTPLIDWEGPSASGAKDTIYTEMLEGDTTTDEIPFAANYIQPTTGIDSRSRTLSSKRYGDKVQMHESENIFQQWRFSGGRDWRPLLRSLLGSNFIRKHEILSRNAFLLGPKAYWTFSGGGTSFANISGSDIFNLDIVNDWGLRLGNTGTPVIPGDTASAKLAMIPPGIRYDIMSNIANASTNEASMWRDAQIYSGQAIRNEIGSFKGVRFQEVPNNRYGENLSVLYNAGVIEHQYGVASAIAMGDGAPDPELTVKVDDVWSVGQKGVTHYIQLESGATMTDFAVGDLVTLHVHRTDYFGITNGVDFRNGRSVTRKVISSDNSTKRLQFDRPIMLDYKEAFVDTPQGRSSQTLFAFVTKARHIGMTLVLGSRGGIRGKVDRPVRFYEPKPVDDFESVWRFTWDEYAGYNLWEPNLFEIHFSAVTLPKAGGKIAP